MRTGTWLIGARGSVAVTSMIGALAVRAGLIAPTGCVLESPALRERIRPGIADLVFGGHDVTSVPLEKKAAELAGSGVVPAALAQAVKDDLAAVEQRVRPLPAAPTQAGTAHAIADDLDRFRRQNDLDRVVVINVSTTEPAPAPHPAHASLDDLRAALADPLSATDPVLPPSSLAAYAALTAGCPYVDFTPSTGARLPALDALARERGLPYAGHDGKTGETLVKSVLAPMFAQRNLKVRTWSGINLLGGGDGANLARPGANAAKSASKQRVLPETLGYLPQGETRIDYLEDLGDFKTAWDLVTFEGFLGTGMRMEFTWHGCDSALAAPLVLDLARLTAAAHHAGRAGPLPGLAFFFKDPLGEVPHGLADQWRTLCDLVTSLTPEPTP
ncbi:Inositol-1-phosphate synthase [[Actinomadura] parvosata subsp. kistnae]|uniref:Myo-inositol-1-phosphate synthase n=1 Tax=[Actinomadura] parvosata subsp. kistnae TaxID=1909395 RepID=A0A1V0A1M5_9ACTN|nr:inositol-3-phosphate synthase [Nonomuraea sp. ATCC 55076]AQZ64126.1 myo-inositol-1-phosphate synthase [Nonomuraea sp. ATCC 55076]SPL87392.1 Inositol-1-phosphate synthase [Actinomadura parvosata subsp. kistnae]